MTGMGEKTFYKSDSNRTAVDVQGSTYSIRDEWQALRRMYEACPEYVPEPLEPEWVDPSAPMWQRELSGYRMESFDEQIKLKDAVTDPDWVDEAGHYVDELAEVVDTLHRNSVPHGDLYGNVSITEDGLKIYDPAGLPNDSRDETFMKKDDRADLRKFRNDLAERLNT